jgi:RND family efflux transporter MFP subunit
MSKIFKIIAFVIMMAVLVWGGYKTFFQKEKKEETEVIKAEEKNDSEETETKKEASLPVTLLRIKRGDLPLRLPISATADVWEKATIKAEVDGTVQKIHYPIGAQVEKDRELVKLDDSEIKLAVERAEAARLQGFSKYLVSESINVQEEEQLTAEDKKKLENLKSKYSKAVKDFENGKISEKQLDEISEEYEEAMVYAGILRDEIRKAQEGFSDADIALKQAKLNLKRTSIKSPFPGTISDIMISTGERLTTGQEILKIVNLQSLYLKGFALESEVKHLKKGISVRIKFDSFPDRYFHGRIESISPEIDPENKTISIFVDVDNKENLILPGMHAEIDVEYQVFKNVLKVPRNAIITRQRPLIFIVNEKDRIALWEYVEVGEKNDEDQIIIRGLNNGVKEGDLVVIDGHLTLAHQSRVKILNIIDQE